MIKTYKVGYELNTTSSNVWQTVTPDEEYYIDIPFKLPELLQYYDPATPCKVLLEHMFLQGATNTPDALKVRYIGNALPNSYNVRVSDTATTYESFDILGEAATVTGKSNNPLLFISREQTQPDHDFDLLTSTGAVASGGPYLRIGFKALGRSGTSNRFTPAAGTKLDLCLVFVVLEKKIN
jgi:hypothetical protein